MFEQNLRFLLLGRDLPLLSLQNWDMILSLLAVSTQVEQLRIRITFPNPSESGSLSPFDSISCSKTKQLCLQKLSELLLSF